MKYYITVHLINKQNKEVLRKELDTLEELFNYDELRKRYLLWDEELDEALMLVAMIDEKELYKLHMDNLILGIDINDILEKFPNQEWPERFNSNEFILCKNLYNKEDLENSHPSPVYRSNRLHNLASMKFRNGDYFNIDGSSLQVINLDSDDYQIDVLIVSEKEIEIFVSHTDGSRFSKNYLVSEITEIVFYIFYYPRINGNITFEFSSVIECIYVNK